MEGDLTQFTPNEVSKTQLRLLDLFAAECTRHELKFFLYYGSLIGAVRHKGMIPWDDDIDLAMPRESYEKLKDINWGKFGCRLIDPRTDRNSPYLLIKISDMSSVLMDEIDGSMTSIGVNIDVFPIDNVSLRSFWMQLRLRALSALKSAQTVKTVKRSKSRGLGKNLLLLVAKMPLLFLSANRLARMANRLASSFGPLGDAASLLGPYGRREFVEQAWVKHTVNLEFEGRVMPAPVGYHQILKRIYGDYMKLPPIEKQVSHHSFLAFKTKH